MEHHPSRIEDLLAWWQICVAALDRIRPGDTKVAEWNHGDDEVEAFDIRTPEYGMDFASEDLGVEDVASESAEVTEAVVTGERDGDFADAVALNAAFRIYAREDCDDLDEGLDIARAAIADGDAAAVLDDLRAF